MPPKKKPQEASKKTEQKKKEKIVEDKTFGLKNKKGAKTQKFIQQVNKSYVEKGVDPKSVLCAFYKQGQCSKGDKCKFSHDLSIERKGEKRSVYCDVRNEDDNMENWDDEKLKEVVEKKHGENERKMPKTDIICKYFLEALENSKYGWFWECPNGGDKCHYRHALPPGFVLQKDKKKQEKKEEISIEDLVERERAKLGCNLTRITLKSFLAWKTQKINEKKEKSLKEEERKKQEYKAGRLIGLSGREMFSFNPDLITEEQMEEGESTFDNITREEEEEDAGPYKEIDLTALEKEAQENDETNAQITTRKVNDIKETPNEEIAAIGGCEESVPIDENLFAEEDENLEELEEEISALTVE
ncbi:zinc finger CCCH domain-containing protein 15-like protein [Dinothrombium tinctorium]|uniref:Zinc finger CCCH domain-containing protein 15-like protein n=1 Tax=Dinothrombium tinctorium TaxID=1965070 RepID=A0A3S3PI45_9ACAR|nr:zinc finger CCCH domain-containing protein 15-like protein [Dinothrombium tinctorium]